jgi:epoxyqueuosine reductase
MMHDLTEDAGLGKLLKPFGLCLIGAKQISHEDHVPDIAENQPARCVLLIGNGGSSLWRAFSQSPEFRDGLTDPLDQWSKRVGDHLAGKLGGRAIFPFDGPPYAPFLSWAGKTGHVLASRISMSIHTQFGLWHAYRFALALPEPLDSLAVEPEFEPPCISCVDQPCLKACPVNAFVNDSYRVNQCMDYLVTDSESDCRRLGCEARRACPVGTEFTYLPEHAKFHMDAFIVTMSNQTF